MQKHLQPTTFHLHKNGKIDFFYNVTSYISDIIFAELYMLKTLLLTSKKQSHEQEKPCAEKRTKIRKRPAKNY